MLAKNLLIKQEVESETDMNNDDSFSNLQD